MAGIGAAPKRRRPRLGYLLPMIVVLLAAGGIAFLWLRPGEEGPTGRWFNSIAIGILALLLLTAWALLFSGWRWYFRVLVVLVEVAAGLVIIPGIVFDGEMQPKLRLPWEATPDDVVAQHRQSLTTTELFRHDPTVGPYDWPEFRGRRRDGVADGPKLSRDWQKKPPKLLWKQPCGPGWSSFAVAGDVAITIEQRHENEAIVAYDIDSGDEVWKHEYPARFAEPLGGIGPRATPTIADGEVYSLGAKGDLVRLEAVTGHVRWSMNILEHVSLSIKAGGGQNLEWAMAGSPLIVGDMVIVNPGRQNDGVQHDSAVLALNRGDGKRVWNSGNTKAGYSSPMLATIGGLRQVVLLDGVQIGGYEVTSGKMLWSFPWDRTNRDINVAQPLIFDDGRVFISSGYNIGCAMLDVKKGDAGAWTVNPLWRLENKPLRCKFTSPVEYQGFLYGIDDPGILACIDAKDGKLRWRDGRYGHGQLLRYDDLLIVLSEKGELVLVEATPESFHELGKVKAIQAERTWNVPALANGRIFVRNDREMACFDLRE